MTAVLDYTSAGPFTRIDGVDPLALESLSTDPAQICRVVPYLVGQPTHAPSPNLRPAPARARPPAPPHPTGGRAHRLCLFVCVVLLRRARRVPKNPPTPKLQGA